MEDKDVMKAVSQATAAAERPTGLLTPRKGTPAEHRTPKESPTAKQVARTASGEAVADAREAGSTGSVLTFEFAEKGWGSASVPLGLAVVPVLTTIALAAYLMTRR
jgi:hypothetical protein